MKKILFIQSQTLYLKTLLPLVKILIDKNFQIYLKSNHFYLKNEKYTDTLERIKKNPTNVNIINYSTIKFVSKLIGLDDDTIRKFKKIKYCYFTDFYKFDYVIGTIKDLNKILSYKYKSKVFAIGYQHYPFLVDINLKSKKIKSTNKLLDDNLFTNFHKFKDISHNYNVIDSSFTYLFNKKLINTNTAITSLNLVLIFHPGGYRDIITKSKDSQKKSYKAQYEFIKKICLPILNNGLIAVIKIHPLCAIFHDYENVLEISKKFLNDYSFNNDKIVILKRDSLYWNYAFNSRFILSFGSSSLYEMWSVGIKNVFICNFFGSERSNKFNFFKSIFLNSHSDYVDFINKKKYIKFSFDLLTLEIMNAYNILLKNNNPKNFFNDIFKS
jgi:hypothetical protein